MRVRPAFLDALPVDAVEEGVDHHVAAVDAELEEEALQAMAGLPDEDPPGDRLVLGGVLADDEHARGAVEPPAVEDRVPIRGGSRRPGRRRRRGSWRRGRRRAPRRSRDRRRWAWRQSYTRRGGEVNAARRGAEAPRRVRDDGQKGATCGRSFAICGTAANACTAAGAGKPTVLPALRARSGQRHVVDVGLDGGVDARRRVARAVGRVAVAAHRQQAGVAQRADEVLRAAVRRRRVVRRRRPRAASTDESGTLNGPSNASLSWTG